MNKHIKDFFIEYSDSHPNGRFYRAISLHDCVDIDWITISNKVPNLPKGWFELCQLSSKDRIQFTMEFWLSKLPYHPTLTEFLMHFFAMLDDIGVYITKKNSENSFAPYMVYSVAQDRCFYRGSPPASEENILDLQKSFPDFILPSDYIAFLQIHDGFWKATDNTGIISSEKMKMENQKFQQLLSTKPPVSTVNGIPVNPSTLIPFYESFGMPYYQCFWKDWFPENEMGNVYYSSTLNTISDTEAAKTTAGESMSFPTFSDWLMFYLEQII